MRCGYRISGWKIFIAAGLAESGVNLLKKNRAADLLKVRNKKTEE
jgi:hypothetical protein